MRSKIAYYPASNRTWSGLAGSYLMFWIAFWAAMPTVAQQFEPAASPRQSEAAISNGSAGQATWPSSVEVSPSNESTQPTLAPARPTLRTFSYSPMTRDERWQDYKDQNFQSYGAFFQAFFTGLGDELGDVPRWDSGMAGLSEHVGSEFARFTIGGDHPFLSRCRSSSGHAVFSLFVPGSVSAHSPRCRQNGFHLWLQRTRLPRRFRSGRNLWRINAHDDMVSGQVHRNWIRCSARQHRSGRYIGDICDPGIQSRDQTRISQAESG